MSPKQISRRAALSVGGVLAGLGVVGASAFQFVSDDDQTPGADGFTATTVPSGSDPLALVDVDTMAQDATAMAVTRLLLSARQFEDLPDALVRIFENGSQPAVDTDSVGKLLLVGSDTAPDRGGAVVWANWTEDELLGVLKSAGNFESAGETAIQTESYRGRTLYTTEEASAAVLGDSEFALGTTAVVRDIVDVWHGDADPVGGRTLNSFERTPLGAHVRFTFEKLLLACDTPATPLPGVYDRITQIYGWVRSDENALQLRLRVESTEASSEVATAVSATLGLASEDEEVSGDDDTALPREAVKNVAVGHEQDFVTVEYSPDPEDGRFVGAVIEATACLTGRTN